MYILKILEGVLQAGASQISFTDTDIPNSAISTFTSKDGLYPTRSVISGSTITLYYQPQSTNTNIALKLVRGNLEIIDALTDTSTNKALSANQGKELKDLIDNIIIPVVPENITDLNDVSVSSIQNGQVLAWSSESEKFENVNQSGGSGSQDYSYDETVIGAYCGKPLYRKCFPTVTKNSGATGVTHNLGIKYYINIGGSCTVNNDPTSPRPFPFIQSRWNGYCNIQGAGPNDITLDASWNNNIIDFYIEYTKLADYE